ncbi:MAG: hypothetical protein XD77_0081 [Marinimicrobia bacterium 46_47]|nr:MAG: hypothetical protein XD77_0081 [Marinimicrobia bacterium 46_47]KUK93770.1 MAG: hypothetical protein XE04_0055 [Marinimicrobia bacterium 46_43]
MSLLQRVFSKMKIPIDIPGVLDRICVAVYKDFMINE